MNLNSLERIRNKPLYFGFEPPSDDNREGKRLIVSGSAYYTSDIQLITDIISADPYSTLIAVNFSILKEHE